MKVIKFIIDAGHGGRDNGGGSNKYWKEKDKTLKISLYQYKRFIELKKIWLKQGIDFKIYLTRDRDLYLPSGKRTAMIRGFNADYGISNHINSYTSSAKGAEIAHSIYSNGKWANLVLDGLVKEGAHRRRVFTRKLKSGKDYYYMHRDTGSTEFIIVEYGFASNSEDTQKLLKHDIDYAESVIKSTCAYLGLKYYAPNTSVEKNYLQLGDKGTKVEYLQQSLIKLGYSLGSYGADGSYGSVTEEVVRNFQEDNKIKVDGYAGPNTIATIEKLLKDREKPSKHMYRVQVGAYTNKNNAEKMLERVESKGIKGFIKIE